MDKWLETPRQYPRLTLDTLAFAIAMDILINPADHIEFIPGPPPPEAEDDLVDAVHADIRDLIKNGNEDDYLIYFCDTSDSGAYERLSKELVQILDRREGEVFSKYVQRNWRLAEKVASILQSAWAGIPGRFGAAASNY